MVSVVTNDQIVNNIRASFAMEGISITEEDEERGRHILAGTRSIEQIILEITEKYRILSRLRSKRRGKLDEKKKLT